MLEISHINIPMKNEYACDIMQPQPAENVVYFLIKTIVLVFIGPYPTTLDKSNNFLINFKYPTLTYFRWSEYIFLSKVMKRDNTNADFLKEKFVARFFTLLAQKVKD